MVKTRSLYLTWSWIDTGSWQMDRITIANTCRWFVAAV